MSSRECESQPQRRRRPALSCIECRRRKIRCDRTEPCKNCTSSRIYCAYKVFTKSTPAPAADSASVNPNGTHHAAEQSLQSPLHGSPLPQAVEDGYAGRSKQDLRYRLLNGNLQSEHTTGSEVSDPAENGWQILKHQVGVKDHELPLNKTRVPRWSEWIGTGPEFSTVHALFVAASTSDTESQDRDPATASAVREMSDLMRKSKDLARSVKSSWASKFTTLPVADLMPPSREMSDIMAGIYFTHFESTHRILHAPTFWTQYELFWSSPINTPIELRLTVLLVVTIGASLHESLEADEALLNLCLQCISAAQRWLVGPQEKARLSITGIQIHCLAFLARQVFAAGSDCVWASLGSIISNAILINLHRDPKHLPNTSTLEAEIRRRLWATVLELELQTALDMALPARLSAMSHDVDSPANIDDDQLDAQTTTFQAHAKDAPTDSTLQILLLKTVPVRLRLLDLLNGISKPWTYAQVLELQRELVAAIAPCNVLTQARGQRSPTGFHRNLVEFLVRRFLLPLHCPFVSASRSNPNFHYSRKASLDTAISILSFEVDDRFTRMVTLGGNFLRESLRCAVMALSVELMMGTDEQYRNGTLRRASGIPSPQRALLQNVISLAAEQIKRHETNISLHMVLNMVLARNEAVARGRPTDLAMSQAAIESLQLCYGLLQEASSRVHSPASATYASVSPADGLGDMDFMEFDWDLGWDLDGVQDFGV